ncbi:MAG: DNA cytosine methyltransferase [Alphaproteobacteria bacterium]|nr:DNA cytosine methyltransferase [Alphaproteobacteria bacterium]
MIGLAPDELILDSFAGGGGASTGIEWALGRSPDVAINHDAEALALHAANHPDTLHLCQSVWKLNPADVVAAGARHRGIDPATAKVGLAWFSPDCKDFSKAKGGTPRNKNIRDLAWVVVHYARQVKPRIIALENVEEFQDWAPLRQRSWPGGEPMLDLHGNPVLERHPTRKGETFRKWVRELKAAGYRVEWRELRACDFGTPTIRKRLFVVARCDGQPIVWPKPTHAKDGAGGLKPWRTAAQCIDWTLPTPSIFLSREEGRKVGCNRPLADATMARIARGVKRYVLDAGKPFIVPITHTKSGPLVQSIDDPLRTITTAKGGELAYVAAHVTKFRTGATGHDARDPLATVTANSHTAEGRQGGAPPLGVVAAHLEAYYGAGEGRQPRCAHLDEPIRTVMTENRHAVVSAFMAQHNTGVVGHDVREPVSTIVGKGCTQAVVKADLVAPIMSHAYTSNTAGGQGSMQKPVKTIVTGGHHSMVAAFLAKYYGTGGQDQAADDPAHTIPTKARLAAVTVEIDGQTYAVVDIGMRMLSPRELYRAQGFPDTYRIEIEHNGKRLSKAAQIRMCGNSVCPPLAAALIAAQFGTVFDVERIAA